MIRSPALEELVGADVEPAERERLQRVHELLLAAGPLPELTRELEAGPKAALARVHERRRRRFRRRAALLAAGAVAVGLVFLGGYIAGNGYDGGPAAAPAYRTLDLHGTATAKGAIASLRIRRARQGNWPLTLDVVGLPPLSGRDRYEVYLVRDGEPRAPCGSFVVRDARRGLTITLNAPFPLRPGDSWIVTRRLGGADRPGPPVLVPG